MPSLEVIDAQLASHAKSWNLPQFENGAANEPVTAEKIENIEETAYREGFERGYTEGMEKGHAQGLVECQRQSTLLSECVSALSDPLSRQEESLEQAIIELALKIGSVLAASELRALPVGLRNIVQSAVDTVAPPATEVIIEVHPARLPDLDRALLRAPLSVACNLRGNEQLAAEDCRVLTSAATVDASLERRSEELLASLLEAR